jgi:tetratricopeptide (TPR) repeat protein
MGSKQSKPADKSVDTQQASAHSKGATPRQRVNVQTVQNVLVIWLDNNIDENSIGCRNTITQLRRIVNDISTFTDDEECVQFLENITDNRACMIISGSLGQFIVPRVHNMSQVDSIFIFCDNEKRHEQWAKAWPKIKGVFTEMSPICEALKRATQQCEQNAVPISFIATSDDITKNLDQLHPTFMYTQILNEILLKIKFDEGHIHEFTNYCRTVFAENETELRNVDEVQKTYHDKTPIWWYTCECFLCPMLNRALMIMDMDIIIKMGFFISDLHRHIEQLHSEQFNDRQSDNSFTVYRGHGMSKWDFDQMTKLMGGLVSFNNFLSTSKDRDVSLDFARRAVANFDMVGILFIMRIDPAVSTTPFASIVDFSYYQGDENEVLFSMNTVFRIGEIKPMDASHRLFQVDLTLTSDNDKDLHVLADHILEKTNPDEEGWHQLGRFLLNLGQSDKAQQVYKVLLEQATDENEKKGIYHQLGWAKYNLGEYNEALTFFKKAVKLYEKELSPTDHILANCYNDIGVVYYGMGDYSKALSYYEKAMEIKQQSLPSNHPDLTNSYINIGVIHGCLNDYPKALSLYEKALEIQEQTLPPNHPELANTYNNIGNAYNAMKDFQEAFTYHTKAFEIRHQSLPPNHPDLAASYGNMGLVCNHMGSYSEALWLNEKALEILEQTLSPNHPDLAAFYNQIAQTYFMTNNYSKALSCCQRAVDIGQHSLPPNHPHLQWYRDNLDKVKEKL